MKYTILVELFFYYPIYYSIDKEKVKACDKIQHLFLSKKKNINKMRKNCTQMSYDQSSKMDDC